MKRGRHKLAKRQSREDRLLENCISSAMDAVADAALDDEDAHGPCCKRCGGSCEWEDCGRCGGGGDLKYPDCPDAWGEDSPSEVNHLIDCPDCGGFGGYWRCGNTFDYCNAHPQPGREETRRTG